MKQLAMILVSVSIVACVGPAEIGNDETVSSDEAGLRLPIVIRTLTTFGFHEISGYVISGVDGDAYLDIQASDGRTYKFFHATLAAIESCAELAEVARNAWEHKGEDEAPAIPSLIVPYSGLAYPGIYRLADSGCSLRY